MTRPVTAFYPFYETRKVLFWFVWIFTIVYVIGVGLEAGLFANNLSSVYTYFKNPGAPGAALTSFRYTFPDIAVRLLLLGHTLFLVFFLSMVLFRTSFGCNVFWFILVGICILLVFLGLIGLAPSYVECNGQNQYGNLCNSGDWCCVEEIRLNPVNSCPNVLPCVPPKAASDLSPNPDFLGLFWTNFVLMLMQFVVVIVVFVYWWTEVTPYDTELIKTIREKYLVPTTTSRARVEETPVPTPSAPPPSPPASEDAGGENEEGKPTIKENIVMLKTTNTKKLHGLRQKKQGDNSNNDANE